MSLAVSQRVTSWPSRRDWLLAAALVMFGVAWRLGLDAPNFAPVAAIALFGGAILRSRALAWALPLAVMGATDPILGFAEPGVVLAVYAGLLAPVAFSRFLRRRRSAWRIAGAALASSVAFFVVTNLAVWLWSGWYEPALPGLARCFVAAIPFFKYTAAGDLFFATAFFGLHALAVRRADAGARAPSTVAASAA